MVVVLLIFLICTAQVKITLGLLLFLNKPSCCCESTIYIYKYYIFVRFSHFFLLPVNSRSFLYFKLYMKIFIHSWFQSGICRSGANDDLTAFCDLIRCLAWAWPTEITLIIMMMMTNPPPPPFRCCTLRTSTKNLSLTPFATPVIWP